MNFSAQLTPVCENRTIQKASHGDLAAFNQIVLNYQDIAFHHAYSLLSDNALAEDAVQESMIKAYQHIDRFHGGSFRAWLLRIVTNTAFDLMRQARRRPTLPLSPIWQDGEELESLSWIVDPSPAVQTLVEQNEETRCLHRLLAELSEIYRSVLILVDFYELDYTEAAQVLNVPVGTVKSRLARARWQIKDKFQSGMNTPTCRDVSALCRIV